MSIQLSGKPDEEAAFLFELGRRVRHARHTAGLTRKQLYGRLRLYGALGN